MSQKTVKDLIEYLQTLPEETIIYTLKKETGRDYHSDYTVWDSNITFEEYSDQFQFVDWEQDTFIKDDDPKKHTKCLYIGED